MNGSALKDIILQRTDLPALYHTATLGSGDAQTWLSRLTKLNFIFLALGAAFFAFDINDLILKDWQYAITYLGTSLLVLSTIITFAMERKQYEKKWYDGRAIAESIKTISWKFMMNSEPYRSENDPEESFRKSLYEILKSRRSFAELLGGDIAVNQQLTETMKRIKKSDLETRKHIYLTNRISQQKTWYGRKSKENRRWGDIFFWAVIAIQVIAILTAIIIIGNPDVVFNPTEVWTTIAAGLLGWMQLKQFRTLAESYGLTTHELGIIESRLDRINSNTDFSEFVTDAETAISREHTTWLARRINI